MKEEPVTQVKERKTATNKNRASTSGGSGGSNLSSMFSDVSSSFRLVCKSISDRTSPQVALAPPPTALVAVPVSAIDAALDFFTLDYSKLFSVPDRLLFKNFLTDNDKIPGMFMRLDSEERLLFIQESIDNNK